MAKYTKPDYSKQWAGAGVTLQGDLTFSYQYETKTDGNIAIMNISKNNDHVLQLFGETNRTNDGVCDFLTIERKV